MKYKKIGVLLFATSLLLAACNDEKEVEKPIVENQENEEAQVKVEDIEDVKINEPQIGTDEKNVLEKENQKKYEAPPNSEWIGISGVIKEQIDDETVLITTEEGSEIYFNVVPELREKIKTGAKGESISFDYYEKGESKIIAKILFNERKPEKVNEDTASVYKDTFEFQGLADSRSMQITKDGNYYFAELNEQQILYLEENAKIGDMIEIAYSINEYGMYKVKSIQKKD